MKPNHLKKLAIIGLTSGLLITPDAVLTAADVVKAINKNLEESKKEAQDKVSDAEIEKNNKQNSTYHLMTEDELYGLVNAQTWKLFQGLDAQGKALALKMASQACNGTNGCKHQNACQTASNDCAGKGICKGKSKCSFGNKNLAVKVASQVMQERRQGLLPQSSD